VSKRFRRAGAAIALLAAGCSRGVAPDGAESAPPVRLLERLSEVVVASGGGAVDFVGRRPAPLGVEGAAEAAFEARRPDRQERKESAGAAAPEGASLLVASVMRAGAERYDRRVALVVVPGTRLEWSRRVEAPFRLRVAVAAIAPTEDGAGKARFRVSAGPAAGPLAAVAEVELDAVAHREWRELDLELPRAGFERLELAVDAGGAALGAWATPELVPVQRAAQRRTNLILISLDTLRADRLGAYGYTARPTSPHLDRFAARAVRFDNPIAQAPWTRPSHRSMLSGVYPASLAGLERRPLADVLWRAGYSTAALTAGGQVDARFGFDAGFERYEVESKWVRTPERALEMIDEEPRRPFFLFLHTYEIHDPYEDTRFVAPGACPALGGTFTALYYKTHRGRVTEEEKGCVAAMYDGDIAFTDEKLGRLFARLDAAGRMDDTIVVVTSDHGEQLWEHGGWRHGNSLYEHQVRVPLLVYLPEPVRERFASGTPGRRPGSEVESPVALVDLAPTFYELLGVPVTHAMQGESLVPLLAGKPSGLREILSENINSDRLERKSIRTDRFKFIRNYPKHARSRKAAGSEFLLFELRRDPGELKDLSASYPDAVRALAARLEAITAGRLGELDEDNPRYLDAEFRKELRALGYLGN
jgi:arylsulfatase A-like enzyme